MEEPDVNESVEDQVTESSGQDDPQEAEDAPAEAESESGPGEVDTADLACETHGGELRPAPGKYRWICDRTQEPGDCVAGYRE